MVDNLALFRYIITMAHLPQLDISTLYQLIGRNINRARVNSELTQEELANLTNISRTSITNIEKGRQKLPIHTLYSIAATLEVDVVSLLPKLDLAKSIKYIIPNDLSNEEESWLVSLVEDLVEDKTDDNKEKAN